MLRKLFLIGTGIGHSLSPELYRRWLSRSKLDSIYLYSTIDTDDFDSCISRTAYGYSVTSPFKSQAYKIATHHDIYSRISRASNTLRLADDLAGYSAYNTDAMAFESFLRSYMSKVSANVSIFGNGATARSVLTALYMLKFNMDITIYCRCVRTDIHDVFGSVLSIRQVPLNHPLQKKRSLIFNTIPSSCLSQIHSLNNVEGDVFECSYETWPNKSALLAQRNTKTGYISPFRLLLLQGIIQFKILTNS